MLLNKQNLAIVSLAPTDGGRFSLEGVRITPEETLVTNGHLLIRVTTPNIESMQFPQIHGLTSTDSFEPFTLPRAAALAIEKAIPGKSTIPVLCHAVIGKETDDSDNAVIGVTDMDMPQLFSPRKLIGDFPDLDKVTPPKEGCIYKVVFNVKYMIALLKQVEKFHASDGGGRRFDPGVALRLYGEKIALRLDTENDDGQKLTAVLMPMNSGDATIADARNDIQVLEAKVDQLRKQWAFSMPGAQLAIAETPDEAGVVRAVADGLGHARVDLIRNSAVVDRRAFDTEEQGIEFIRGISERTLTILGDLEEVVGEILDERSLASNEKLQVVFGGYSLFIVRRLARDVFDTPYVQTGFVEFDSYSLAKGFMNDVADGEVKVDSTLRIVSAPPPPAEMANAEPIAA
jgi:hypothetical protein